MKNEDSDDIAYPSSIGFVLIHLGCFGVFWTGFTWRAFVLAVVLYLMRIFAIGAGYHRYFAHRAFRTSRVMQFCLGFQTWSPIKCPVSPIGTTEAN